MLKGLKNKKDGKADPKKDKKDKQSKKDPKKQVKQQEEEIGDPLVDMSQFDNTKEEPKTTKKMNKILNSKLEEKQIDTSNIIVEKKEEKKEIKSWIVEQSDISKTFVQKFDMNKVDTEFQSLTDEKLNKELQIKAKKQAEQNKFKVVEEKGGIKFAPLEKPATSYVDANEPNFIKRSTPAPVLNLNPGIQIASNSSPPQFTNSKAGLFVPLEKTPQQLKEEEMERRAAEISIAPKKQEGWLGKKEQKPVEPEIKVSTGWATKAAEQSNVQPIKFATLQKTAIEKRYERQEQQYVFVSKKEQDERRKKRQQEKEKANKA